MDFLSWITSYAVEKKLDLNQEVKAKNCTLQVGNVLNAFCNMDEAAQVEIKKIFMLMEREKKDPMFFIRLAAKDLDYTHKHGNWTGKTEIFSC